MTRKAAATVRRPGVRMAPAISTSTCGHVGAVKPAMNGCIQPSNLSGMDKLKRRFKLQRVVMVGDRGLLTSARIEETLRPAGLDWITALRAPAIKALAAEGGPLQPSLFDHRD